MASSTPNFLPLSSCKLVDAGEDGELRLVKDNVNQVLNRFKENLSFKEKETPIALLSVLGPPQSGKSFFTNLVTEYLKCNDKAWIKNLGTRGLRGFQYGPSDNHVAMDNEQLTTGVYFWPQMFPLNHQSHSGPKLVWIMHVVHATEPEMDAVNPNHGQDPLDLFLRVASSRILNIILNEKSIMDTLENEPSETHPLAPHFCDSILHLQRPNASAPELREIVCMQNLSTSLHDQEGKMKLSMSIATTIKKMMRQLTDEMRFYPKKFGDNGEVLRIDLIDKFLYHCVYLVNISRGFKNQEQVLPITPDFEKNCPDTSNASEIICEETTSEEKMRHISDGCEEDNENTEENTVNESNSFINIMKIDGSTPKSEGEDNKSPIPNKDTELEELRNQFLGLSVQPIVQTSFDQWINHNLTRNNIGQIQKTINQVISDSLEVLNQKEMVDLRRKGLSEDDAKEVVQAVNKTRETVIAKTKMTLLSAVAGIESFCTEIETQLQNVPQFTQKDFKQIHKAAIEKVASAIDDKECAELVELSAIKLHPEFEEIYQQRCQEEESLVLNCIQTIRTFHECEMTRTFPPNKCTSLSRLVRAHQCLVDKLTRIFKEALDYHQWGFQAVEKLRELLHDDFYNLHFENIMTSMEIKHKSIKSLILNWKSRYEEQMNTLLETSSDGIEFTKFDADERKIQDATIEGFQLALNADFQNKVFAEYYLKTLRKHVENSSQLYRKENADNIKNNEKKPDESRVDSDNPCEDSQKQSTCEKAIKASYQKSEQTKSALLVQLARDKIRVAHSNGCTITSAFDDPPQVGITHDNEWMCGNGVGKLREESSLRDSWDILEILYKEGCKIMGEETFRDVKLPITADFLLAIYFRNVKQQMEDKQGEHISTIYVSLPFWWSSKKRQQIHDAAQIAGFESITILNEISCAAYYMYDSGKHRTDYDTIVLSENSGMVDVTIYSYELPVKRLSMISHCGNCDTNDSQSRNQNSLLGGIACAIMNRLGLERYGQSQLQGDDDHTTVNNVYNMCKKAFERATKSRIKNKPSPLQFLIHCQSEKWERLLKVVAKKFADPNENITVDNSTVINGIASIYMRCVNGGLLVKFIHEGIPFYVNIYSPGEPYNRKVAFNKKDTFIVKRTTRNLEQLSKVKFDFGTERFEIFQENVSTYEKIATLQIHNYDREKPAVAITLKRFQSGIIGLEKVETMYSTFSNLQKRTIHLKEDAFEWKKSNLTDEEKALCMSVMDQIVFYNDKTKRLLKEKQSISERCERILKDISENKGTLTGIVKNLVISEVKSKLEQVREPNCTEHDITQISKVLKNYELKYNLGNMN